MIKQASELQDTMIEGEGIKVAIDKSKIYKVNNSRGHRVDYVWILGCGANYRKNMLFKGYPGLKY